MNVVMFCGHCVTKSNRIIYRLCFSSGLQQTCPECKYTSLYVKDAKIAPEMDLAGADPGQGRSEPRGRGRADGSGDAQCHEQEAQSCMGMTEIHTLFPRPWSLGRSIRQVFSSEGESWVNILPVTRLTFPAWRVCTGRTTCILFSEASCLRDTSKKGHREQ